MKVALGLCGLMTLGIPTFAVDDVRLLRLTPPSGEILGTWDVAGDWHEEAGSYVEAEFAYSLSSVPVASVNWWPDGLRSMASHGWRTFGPGTGRFTVRFTRNCEGEAKVPAPIASGTFRYFLSESLPTGMTLRVLDSGEAAAAYRFVCPPPGLPDLTVGLAAPVRLIPGVPLPAGAAAIVHNRGGAPAPGTIGALDPANGYMVDLVLSKDKVVPEGFARFSPTFREDVLLRGGRVSRTADLAAGAAHAYPVAGASIPFDTPPGRYFLCARVDPGRRVRESNERNNVGCVPVQVVPR